MKRNVMQIHGLPSMFALLLLLCLIQSQALGRSITWGDEVILNAALVFPTTELMRQRCIANIRPGEDETIDLVRTPFLGPVLVGPPADFYLYAGRRIFAVDVTIDGLLVHASGSLNSPASLDATARESLINQWLLESPGNRRTRDYVINLSHVFGHEAFIDRIIGGRRMTAVPMRVTVHDNRTTIEFKTLKGDQLTLVVNEDWIPIKAMVNSKEILIIDDGSEKRRLEDWGTDDWSPPQHLKVSDRNGDAEIILRNSRYGQMLLAPGPMIVAFAPTVTPSGIYTSLSGGYIVGVIAASAEAELQVYCSNEKLVGTPDETIIAAMKRRSRDLCATHPPGPTFRIDLERLFGKERIIRGRSSATIRPPLHVTAKDTVLVRIGQGGALPAAEMSIELTPEGRIVSAKYKPTDTVRDREVVDLDSFPETVQVTPVQDAVLRR
jgi:hypothetical protein